MFCYLQFVKNAIILVSELIKWNSTSVGLPWKRNTQIDTTYDCAKCQL